MKKKFLKLSTAFALCLIVVVSFVPYAIADEIDSPSVVKEVHYFVETDTEKLLQYLCEPIQEKKSVAHIAEKQKDRMFVDQKKSETYYSDGSKKIDFVRNTFGFYVDGTPQAAVPADLIGPSNGSNYKTLTHKNILVNIQTNYQTWLDKPDYFEGTIFARITSCTVTVIGDQVSGQMVKKLEIGIWSRQNIYDPTKGASRTVSYPTSQTPYQLYNTDQTIYEMTSEYNVDIYSIVGVTFDDNKYLELQTPWPWRS